MSEHAPSSAPPPDDPPKVPDYDLLRLIGQGGFGQVWLARNQATGHLRAVKLIPLQRSGTTGYPQAGPADREITSITRLEAHLRRQHPNLLGIHHVGKTAEHLFYIMDLADDVSGGPRAAAADYRPATLQSRLAHGPLPPEECRRYAGQLFSGLASLHAAGMVHRDVKPANCLLVDGELKLADFGLVTQSDPQVSRVGTLRYMPPDGHMDARADVYAAGLVLYEMLTGLPADAFPRLGDRAAEAVETPVLGALNRIALRACEPDPQQRFRDAQEMLVELMKVPDAVSAEHALSRRARRLVSPLPIVALAVVVLAVLAAVGFWATRPSRVHVNFVTHPFEATIYLDGMLQKDAEGHPCRTPCTIEDLPPRVHHVEFRHETLGRLDAGRLDFARERRIEVRWDPRE